MSDNGWIQTFLGKRIYPLDPSPKDIDIVDIAHALSMQCRFTGHTRVFYSVAQHSVLVSQLCDPADALWGLLHDASEAYLQDVARPIKRAEEMEKYRTVERVLQEVIVNQFELHFPQPESVTQADELMLAIEAKDLMSPLIPGWEPLLKILEAIKVEARLGPIWSSTVAKNIFLARFESLLTMRTPPFSRGVVDPVSMSGRIGLFSSPYPPLK
jgi:hypothetical protein